MVLMTVEGKQLGPAHLFFFLTRSFARGQQNHFIQYMDMWLPPNSLSRQSKKSKVKNVFYNASKKPAENNLASSVLWILVGKKLPCGIQLFYFHSQGLLTWTRVSGLEKTPWCLPALASDHKKCIPGLLFCLSSKVKFPKLGKDARGAAFLLLLHLPAKLVSDKLQKTEMCNGQNVPQFLQIC